MKYRKDKYGNEISLLGYGCMRLPQSGGRIDIGEAEKLIMSAVEAGVNYFDTAYIYPGSEAALGEILERGGVRDKVFIASKLPHYLIKSREGAEKFFNEELKRLRTDHIDYYLMHMLTDIATWERLRRTRVDTRCIDVVDKVLALDDIHLTTRHLGTQRCIESKVLTTCLTVLCGNHHNTIGTTRTIDGC